MKTNHSSINLPFSIICSKSSSSGFEFMVNFGSINDFIFSTYKRFAKPFGGLWASGLITDTIENEIADLKKLVEDEAKGIINSSARYENNFIYKLSNKLQKTFKVSQSCSVYLIIPKIPAGFDYFKTGVAFSGKTVWWLQRRTDFLNQFTIETDKDDGFNDRLENNIKFIEKNNPFTGFFSNVDLNQKLEDVTYPGKFYIKLADIIIKDTSYEINYFFRSNLIAPIRWFNLIGAQRAVSCLAQYCWIEKGEFGDNFKTSQSSVNHPKFLLKTLEEIKTNCEQIMLDLHENIYQDIEPKIEDTAIYRLFLVYLNQADAQTNIEVLVDNPERFNSLIEKVKDSYEEGEEPDLPQELTDLSKEDVLEIFDLTENDTFVNIIWP